MVRGWVITVAVIGLSVAACSDDANERTVERTVICAGVEPDSNATVVNAANCFRMIFQASEDGCSEAGATSLRVTVERPDSTDEVISFDCTRDGPVQAVVTVEA